MTNDTVTTAAARLVDDLAAARDAAWEEHQRRCADNEPYTDGVTPDELAERTAQLRREAAGEPRTEG